MRWIGLIAWLALCFAVAAVGGRWTAGEVQGWYHTLHMPWIAPPDWIFAPVWTLLYALMAVAAWRVGQTTCPSARSLALGLFLMQLALNCVWSYLFFHCHEIGGALVEILLLWAAIGATVWSFARVDAKAGWLLAPYWAWVSFASVLNAFIWQLNRR